MNQIATAPALTEDELRRMDAWWRAANYLNVGQIYLSANPLLRQALTVDHIKPRLLGHWGTSPGLNLIYVHMNRLIQKYDLDAIYMAGPGHGGPALLANVYLEGSYTEFYPAITQDEAGLLRLFRQFSTPGGVPSHVSVPTPGSIHEGGELGYVLVHAFGAVMDNPGLLVAAVVGDGEAETGPLAGSWKGIDFINPARDGAVLPILHLNGYKISCPTTLARHSDADLAKFFEGQGYAPCFIEGDDPALVHQAFAGAMEAAVLTIRAIQTTARQGCFMDRPRWPLIVLRTPKGWTGPKIVDGVPVEGTFRAHQVPVADILTNPEPSAHPGRVAAQLPAGGAVRRGRAVPGRVRGAGAEGRPPHGLQPARQRRQADGAAEAAGFHHLPGRLGPTGRASGSDRRRFWAPICGISTPTIRIISAYSARTRPTPTAWAPCSTCPTDA